MGKLLSSNPRQYIAPVIIGLVMSYISSRYLFVGSGLSLIPWGLLALSFGLLTNDKLLATQRGLVYGFAQSFIFLWIDKSGITTLGQFLLLVVIITVLGAFGAGCGWVLSRAGWLIQKRFIHKAR